MGNDTLLESFQRVAESLRAAGLAPRTGEEQRQLQVGVELWPTNGRDGEDSIARVDRTDSDEVGLYFQSAVSSETPSVFFSRAAAVEIGRQLILAGSKPWPPPGA